jgi:hypothetical protein
MEGETMIPRLVALAAPVRQPFLLVPLLLGASSIASLLLYFYGVFDMRRGVLSMLLPAVVLLILVMLWARWTGRQSLSHRMLAGLWAGALATLMYDLVRVPIVWSGLPVFKAISYFGTVIVDTPAPSPLSEVIGWTYHFSNGVGFGLMYAVLVLRPHWLTATLWGLVLEGAMLLTPYAEVFGYRVSPTFLAITIGSHIVYGLTLWAALRYWLGPQALGAPTRRQPVGLVLAFLLAPLGIGAVAADFHQRHAETIPPSPPGYLGPHLYVTWNVLEPDRMAALWVFRRFVQSQARYHFVEPFSRITYGTPFDMPEADIRRQGTRSATEVLLARRGLEDNPRLQSLARMTHLYEITPWMVPADPAAQQLGYELRHAAGSCNPPYVSQCFERALHYLDTWYARASAKPDS